MVIGRQRRPEAVLVSFDRWRELTGSGSLGTLPTWTQEEAVSFEVAEDLLGSMIAWAHAQMMGEREKPDPDPRVVEAWRTQAAAYAQQRRDLRGASPADIARVVREYGPRVRAQWSYDQPDA